MLEYNFEDGFGEIIEVKEYYDWISERRKNKLNKIIE
jgi:hypothetical protein